MMRYEWMEGELLCGKVQTWEDLRDEGDKMIENKVVLSELRQVLGVDEKTPESEIKKVDEEIEKLSPMEKLRLLCQWHFGDPTWADKFADWCEAVGLIWIDEDDI